MIRIGIAGCGFIGTIHSLTIKALVDAAVVDAQVVAVFDPDPARAARSAAGHGAAVAVDEHELIEGIDALWVCTWTSAHRPLVEAASSRGIAVYCEKPLAPTLEESEAVARAARRVRHQVGLVLRHAPVLAAVVERVGSGAYGRPMAALLRDDQYFPTQGQYASAWRADVAVAGGGTLIEHSIHDVDILTWILGPVRCVTGATSSFAGHPGIEDVATATIEHVNGARSSLLSVWHRILSRPSTRRLEVLCEDGLLWTDDDFLGPLQIETTNGVETVTARAPAWLAGLRFPPSTGQGLWPYAIANRAFLDAVAGAGDGRAPGGPTAEDALAAHRTVDAVYRSAAAGGSPVAVGGS